MGGNVLSWKQALEKGFMPLAYDYRLEQVPKEWLDATLDFKIWAKKVLAINGYFSVQETGIRIQLSIYLSKEQTYRVGSSLVDFYRCPLGRTYRIHIGVNGKGNLLLLDIIPVIVASPSSN